MAWSYPDTKTGITVAEVKEDHLFGLALTNYQNVDYSDQQIWRRIRAAEDKFEREMNLPIGRTQTVRLGGDSGQADLTPAALPWIRAATEGDGWFYIELPHKPIRSLTWLRLGLVNDSWVFTIPDGWIKKQLDAGFLQVVPYATGSASYGPSVQLSALLVRLTGRDRVPDVIYAAYEIGITQAEIHDDYNDMYDYLAKMVAMDVLPILAAMKNQDGSSRSESIDGVSRSRSGGDQVLMNTANHYKEECKEWLEEFKQKVWGIDFSIVGT